MPTLATVVLVLASSIEVDGRRYQPQASDLPTTSLLPAPTPTATSGWKCPPPKTAGTPITLAKDGGTGSADNELPAHINIRLADWFSVCGVREFSLDISRDELDVTTLPCSDGGAGCDTLAAFRSTQAGYASATGTHVGVLHLRPGQHRQPPSRFFPAEVPRWCDCPPLRLLPVQGRRNRQRRIALRRSRDLHHWACPSRSTPTIRPPASCPSASPR